MSEDTKRNSMSPHAVFPKPKYEIYGFDSGIAKTEEEIISSKMMNRQVRVPHFEQKQNMHFIDLILDIEGIGNHQKDKLLTSFTPRSLHFTVEDLDGEDIHLIIPRLAHEINHTQSYVTVKNKNTVVITLMKLKPQIWKTVFYNTELVKKLWAQNMREFVQSVIDQEDVASVLKEIWNQAQIICTDDINFFLNAPTPFGPMQSLKGVTTIDEVIEKLKNSITNRNDLFVKAFFLGAAMLYKLQRDHDEEFRETEQTSSNDSESASSNIEEENLSSIEARLKKIAVMDVPERKAFANRKKEIGNKHLRAKRYTVAIRYYSEAIDLHPENPVYYSNRSMCHFILKNYDESFEDACKAMDLDPLFDKGFYRAYKALAALELSDLATKVANLALEFDRENRWYFAKLLSEDLLSLSSSVAAKDTDPTESYIKCELRLKQMENLDKLRKINKEFEDKRNYAKVQAMAEELLEHSKTPTIASGFYYLSYCYFNLNEREAAISNIEKCLKLNADHAPAKRLNENMTSFYSYKDNAFINFVEGKYQECISWYKKGLQLVHGNIGHTAHFQFLMGLTRKAQKKLKDAVKCFSHVIELNNNFIHAYYMRGECYLLLGRNHEAQINFNKAIELYKKEVTATQKSSETNNNSNKTLYIWKNEIDESYQRIAEEHLEKGCLDSAVEHFKLAALCHPENAQVHCQGATAFRKIHRFEEALGLASKAIDLNPELGYAHLEKAKCLLTLGNVERAINSLEQAQKLLPEEEVKTDMGRAMTLRVFLKRGYDALGKGDFEAAEMYFTEARKIAYLDLSLQIKLSECRSQLQSMNTSVATQETLDELHTAENGSCVVSSELQLVDPQCISTQDIPIADTYCIMGACAYHQGNKEEALSHFQKALEHDPNHEKAKEAFDIIQQVFSVFEQACDYLSQDKLKDAQAFFKMGTMLDDENSYMKAKMHHGLGLTYFKMEEYELAIDEFSSAINNDGEFSDVYVKRGECYRRLDKLSKAVEDYKAAIELDPAPEYKEILKLVQKKISYSKAVEDYKAAIEHDPAPENKEILKLVQKISKHL